MSWRNECHEQWWHSYLVKWRRDPLWTVFNTNWMYFLFFTTAADAGMQLESGKSILQSVSNFWRTAELPTTNLKPVLWAANPSQQNFVCCTKRNIDFLRGSFGPTVFWLITLPSSEQGPINDWLIHVRKSFTYIWRMPKFSEKCLFCGIWKARMKLTQLMSILNFCELWEKGILQKRDLNQRKWNTESEEN